MTMSMVVVVVMTTTLSLWTFARTLSSYSSFSLKFLSSTSMQRARIGPRSLETGVWKRLDDSLEVLLCAFRRSW
jgi:hypothetical protein